MVPSFSPRSDEPFGGWSPEPVPAGNGPWARMPWNGSARARRAGRVGRALSARARSAAGPARGSCVGRSLPVDPRTALRVTVLAPHRVSLLDHVDALGAALRRRGRDVDVVTWPTRPRLPRPGGRPGQRSSPRVGSTPTVIPFGPLGWRRLGVALADRDVVLIVMSPGTRACVPAFALAGLRSARRDGCGPAVVALAVDHLGDGPLCRRVWSRVDAVALLDDSGRAGDDGWVGAVEPLERFLDERGDRPAGADDTAEGVPAPRSGRHRAATFMSRPISLTRRLGRRMWGGAEPDAARDGVVTATGRHRARVRPRPEPPSAVVTDTAALADVRTGLRSHGLTGGFVPSVLGRGVLADWAALGVLDCLDLVDVGTARTVVVDQSGPRSPVRRWIRGRGHDVVEACVAGPEATWAALDLAGASVHLISQVHPADVPAADLSVVLADASVVLVPRGIVVVTAVLTADPAEPFGAPEVRRLVSAASDRGLDLVGDLDGDLLRGLRTDPDVDGPYGLVRLAFTRR